MEQWNEICYLINKHKRQASDEFFFQNEVENIFEKLGWSRYKGEIISKPRISIGASNRLEPDMLVKSKDRNLYVVELKHPNHPLLEKQASQLTSYMRQLKLDFGLLIGHKFQLFYDEPSDHEAPVKIFETEFNENNKEAFFLIELLEKGTFNEDNLRSYCLKKIEDFNDDIIAKEIICELESQKSNIILELIKENLNKDYNENIVTKVLEKLKITIKIKGNTSLNEENILNIKDFSKYEKSDKLPIEFVPKDKKKFKNQLILKKEAIEEIHYLDGTINQKIWRVNRFSEKSDLSGNVRSRPYARKGKWKEESIKKIIYRINN